VVATWAPGSTFSNELAGVHRFCAWMLFALIGLHVGASLFHRFVLRDVLPRAGPSRQSHVNRNYNRFRKGQ
jgi:Cytochrome B561